MRKSTALVTFIILAMIAISGCISGDDKIALSEPRENLEAGVKIVATYLPEIKGATAFDIKVTAHSDYDDDFKNNSFLRIQGGKIYQPVSFEGEGGHHASGTLSFPAIEGKSYHKRQIASFKGGNKLK